MGPAVSKIDGITPQTGLSPTVYVSKNGAVQAVRDSASVITHDRDGYYRVPLSATDTDTVGPFLAQFNDPATHLPVWEWFMVLPPSVPVVFTYTVTVLGTATPIPNVTVRFSTDLAGLSTVWTGTTDVLGVARNACGDKPFLPQGIYYVWRTHASFQWNNPDIEDVSY